MKKITILLFSVAALLAGCSKENAPERRYVPDIKFSRTGEVVLEASIENAMAKATMNTIGEARWERNDEIAVVCTDGTLVSLKLDGTGDTRKAFFKGVIPEGKVMGDYAFYPVSAIKSFDGKNLKFEMPEDVTSTTGKCPVMVAKITEGDFKIEMKQLFANMVFRLHSVNNSSRSVQITSDVALSGPVEIEIDKCFTDGVPAVKTTGNPGVTLRFDSVPEETVTFSVAVPVGMIGQLTATTFTSAGKQTASADLLTSPCITIKAATFECEGTLPKGGDKKPIKEGYALVNNTYWALGNLTYQKGVTDEGFETGWGLAKYLGATTQWMYRGYDQATKWCSHTEQATDYTGVPSRRDIHTSEDYYDHFTFGGIKNAFDKDSGFAMAAEGTLICGKMFTDISCTSSTEDFASAVYGDLAYRVSKGKFRLPTKEELEGLATQCDAQFGFVYVLDADGKKVQCNGLDLKVWGWYFTDPAGETPVITTDEREISQKEMTNWKGLFLPLSGRKANSSNVECISSSMQALYWAGLASTLGADGKSSYAWSLFIKNTELTGVKANQGTAFTRNSGWCIRPVYIPNE